MLVPSHKCSVPVASHTYLALAKLGGSEGGTERNGRTNRHRYNKRFFIRQRSIITKLIMSSLRDPNGANLLTDLILFMYGSDIGQELLQESKTTLDILM